MLSLRMFARVPARRERQGRNKTCRQQPCQLFDDDLIFHLVFSWMRLMTWIKPRPHARLISSFRRCEEGPERFIPTCFSSPQVALQRHEIGQRLSDGEIGRLFVFTNGPHESRRPVWVRGSSALEAARKKLARAGVGAEVSSTKDGDEIKLFIRRERNQVKVEVNHVFRGTSAG